MKTSDPDTEELLRRAADGDRSAVQQLLLRHRDRLRRMVALRLDRRLAARVDPSDVVQEVLAEAVQQLSDYLRRRPLPFYPWLRQLAWERLIELYRRHVQAQKRSVAREEPGVLNLPDESAVELAGRLLDLGSSPSQRLLRAEMRGRVQEALARLSDRDREVLVLRHLEQLSTAETAAALGITEGRPRAGSRTAETRNTTSWNWWPSPGNRAHENSPPRPRLKDDPAPGKYLSGPSC